MPENILSQLAPTGVLRAGINMANKLLVTGKTVSGDPDGLGPELAAKIGERLGVGVAYVLFPTPGQLADAVDEAKASGLIARLIEKHGVTGKLSVAHAK